MFENRDYQDKAIENIDEAMIKGARNPLVVAPTGSGKSVIIAGHARKAIEAWPDTRILVLTHVKELIAQNEQAILRLWPDAPTGVYSAGLKRREARAQILFCGIQSVYNKVDQLQWADLIYVDEAHMIPKKATTRYGQFLSAIRAINPHCRVVGFTATPYRLDSGPLVGKPEDGCLFDAICYDIPVKKLLKDGYISPLTTEPVRTNYNLNNVATRAGDYVESQLQAAVNVDAKTHAAVGEILSLGANRKSWIVFTAGVDHAQSVADRLSSAGIETALVLGDTDKTERQDIIDRFKAGSLRCIVNVNVLTTGFDAPGVDLIAMMRPTKSVALYVQMAGRGMRKAPGKENCVVLDFAENIGRMGPIDNVIVPKGSKGEGDAPIKVCPECESTNYAGVRICSVCGHEFEGFGDPELKRASVKDIISDHRPKRYTVSGVSYSRHTKPGKPDSLKITYRCGLLRFQEWVCLEHTGYAKTRALQWWKDRTAAPAPQTITEALEEVSFLQQPTAIMVKDDGRFQSVQRALFEKEAA